MSVQTFSATEYVLGNGAIECLRDLKGEQVGLVVDDGIVAALGLEERLSDLLFEAEAVEYLCHMQCEPTRALLEEPIRACQDFEPTWIVAIAGGVRAWSRAPSARAACGLRSNTHSHRRLQEHFPYGSKCNVRGMGVVQVCKTTYSLDLWREVAPPLWHTLASEGAWMFEVSARWNAGCARPSTGRLSAGYPTAANIGDATASSGRATGRRRLERGRTGKRIPSSRRGTAACTADAVALGDFHRPALGFASYRHDSTERSSWEVPLYP